MNRSSGSVVPLTNIWLTWHLNWRQRPSGSADFDVSSRLYVGEYVKVKLSTFHLTDPIGDDVSVKWSRWQSGAAYRILLSIFHVLASVMNLLEPVHHWWMNHLHLHHIVGALPLRRWHVGHSLMLTLKLSLSSKSGRYGTATMEATNQKISTWSNQHPQTGAKFWNSTCGRVNRQPLREIRTADQQSDQQRVSN